MNLSASRRTWEEASSPAAVRLAKKYEQAWRDSELVGRKPELRAFLDEAGAAADQTGARLALLRADMTLRWDAGEKVGARWYLDRYPDLGEDTIVALIYEEFCLREEDQERPDPADYLRQFPEVALALKRVLEIHELIGTGTNPTTLSYSSTNGTGPAGIAFPEVEQTIAGFFLVEELGRGAFARVFLARERQLADRPVALKVTRRGSHEPQTLARLQHTHIVPVHSHRVDAATGLHLLCMPYFGRITLSRVLADPEVQTALSGSVLVEALDRLDTAGDLPAGSSAGRLELSGRSYPRAIAWWCARLAEALAHAHDRGVLHRDIKPSNVLVTSDGMPMLLDFNLAREPLADDGTTADSANLGGTIDYMAPEHLKSLGEPLSTGADGRADIYALGVVLYEALTGRRPFTTPRRGTSVIDALLLATEERLRPLPSIRKRHSEVPPALEAVIRRCLEPAPRDRYQSAAELATDLHAIADDFPLVHAHEPWASSAAGWVRRRRRRLAGAAVILLAAMAAAVASASVLNDRSKDHRVIRLEYRKGLDAYDNGDFPSAKIHYQAAADLADRYSQNTWGRLFRLKITNIRELGALLTDKVDEIAVPDRVDEIHDHALEKIKLAERNDKTRSDADALFAAANGLRFRLHLGEGNELISVFEDLQRALEPFFVLKNEDWTKLDPILALLDQDRRQRLLIEVNELLFLWVANIDELLDSRPEPSDQKTEREDSDPVSSALAICNRALVWVEPKDPWLAMAARLRKHQATPANQSLALAAANEGTIEHEPARPSLERSPLACFQCGLLALRERRLPRAMDWLRRAVQLEPRNHWYQYFLAYLEDTAGYKDEALAHYNVAHVIEPDSPWILFSRARLYRSKGGFDTALEDMKTALAMLAGRPEAGRVHLERGYLYYELGNFHDARVEYNRVIELDTSGMYAPAARLNLANMDAESGAVGRARQEYDALLADDLRDTSARMSRALLELRQGQANRAYIDCSTLLDMQENAKDRDQVLATRALALLLLNRPAEAIADAREAQQIRPGPARERLRQRAILAARRIDLLQLEDPDEVALLPLRGRRLTADLRATADALWRLASTRPDQTYRASLTLAVIYAVLDQKDAAEAAATRVLEVSPYAPRGHLIRARIRYYGGDYQGARNDVEQGLAVQFNEPGLLELKGILRAAAGDYNAALNFFEAAVGCGAVDRIHLHKAAALMALDQVEKAAQEWSLALRRDPELPEAYLGRARAHLRLRRWDMALADLEQAAAWAHSDPRIELGIVSAYFRCLRHRREYFGRWCALALRTARDIYGVLTLRTSTSTRAH
ncbi:MAG TPA: protein kinase [Isosphaeraceae bacterium]|nr:protein kinase [Isosphaeraceae bacterium]